MCGVLAGAALAIASPARAQTDVSGFVDMYYSYNINKPVTPCMTVGGVAVFNCLHNFVPCLSLFSRTTLPAIHCNCGKPFKTHFVKISFVARSAKTPRRPSTRTFTMRV